MIYIRFIEQLKTFFFYVKLLFIRTEFFVTRLDLPHYKMAFIMIYETLVLSPSRLCSLCLSLMRICSGTTQHLWYTLYSGTTACIHCTVESLCNKIVTQYNFKDKGCLKFHKIQKLACASVILRAYAIETIHLTL